MPVLPARPSLEHLRKHAKRTARERSIGLAQAQHDLAVDYGFRNWTALKREVARLLGETLDDKPPLLAAIRAGDVAAVRSLLEAGENPRINVTERRETPLHIAARIGPIEIVEALIAGGALAWAPDARGRTALVSARRGRGRDRAAIIALLDRSAIADPSFRAAVEAIYSGDLARLRGLLAEQPQLLRARNAGPDVYRQAARHDYFRDPKLFWYVAYNPTPADPVMPANIATIAQAIIDFGVEQSDLDYTLTLVMTSGIAQEQDHQITLMRTLLRAGAVPVPETIVTCAAHWQSDALRALVEMGFPMNALIAAALGDESALARSLEHADQSDVQTAFGLAIINGNLGAARLALAAGADANVALPVHSHSTALHQAALDDRIDIIAFLLANGANANARDTLWNSKPHDWATYNGKAAAAEFLAGHTAD